MSEQVIMLTVIFATYNGEDTLPLMLESLTRCISPPDGWQIIAVDNASKDNSLKILKNYKKTLPLTILKERRQGKNFALNTGIEAAKGDLIIFTDDDIIANEGWLINYQKYVNLQPEISIFGGYIAPHWEKEPPDWVLEWVPFGWVYSLTPAYLQEGELDPGMVFGPNMAIRQKIFNQGYRYDTKIGPDGSQTYGMGSETSFTRMLADKGFKCSYLPHVKVSHIIQSYQLKREWILSRAVRAGRGTFMKSSSSYDNFTLWNNVPRYFIRLYLQHKIRSAWYYIFYNAKNIFTEQWQAHFTKGLMLESYKYFSNRKLKSSAHTCKK